MTEKEISKIAQELLAGFNCHINKDSNEIITIPDIDEFSDNYDLFEDQIKEIKRNRKRYREIERMDSHDYFKVMERFADSVSDDSLREKLLTALQRPKPFANFKFEINNSGPYRQIWFDFQQEQQVEWVKDQLALDNPE
jgi:hypothetical protein